MAYVVAAKWRAHPGKADRLLEVIQEMTPPSRAEPGCLFYQAQRSQEDPDLFFLYEQYVDEAGYQAHQDSEHFTRLVKQEAILELLAERERAFYTTIGDDRGGRSVGVSAGRLVDLSPAVPEGFKGPPSTDVGVAFDVRVKPGYWQSAQATLNCHTGCHVESGLHVFEDGEPIDAVALDRVIGSAVVLDLTPVDARALVDAGALAAAEAALHDAGEAIIAGDIVLLRTDWAQRAIGTPPYFPDSPALTDDAARWLVERRPRCVGCDFFEEPAARDPGWAPEDFVVHRALLGAGIVLVEGLVNLAALPPRCTFFAPFYKFAGIDSAPARAFAQVAAEPA